MKAKHQSTRQIRRRTQSQQLADAFHEAGHAVAAWALNVSFRPRKRYAVTIVPMEQDDFVGFVELAKHGYKGHCDESGGDERWTQNLAYNRAVFERRAVISLAGARGTGAIQGALAQDVPCRR